MTRVKIRVLKILSRFVLCLHVKDRFFVESCTFVHFRVQECPSLCMFVSNRYFNNKVYFFPLFRVHWKHCYIQHTLKMGSERWQHVFALVNWYSEDENKDKYGKPVEVWKTTILPGGPSRFLPVARIFSNFVVASSFEGKIVLVPINRTFT